MNSINNQLKNIKMMRGVGTISILAGIIISPSVNSKNNFVAKEIVVKNDQINDEWHFQAKEDPDHFSRHHQLNNQPMTTQDFTTTISVDKSPKQLFDAINNVRGWWSEEIEGNTDKLNSEFKYHYQDVHRAKMKIIELVPGKKVVWLVLDNYFKFTKDKSEWMGTKIIFEISKKDNKTLLTFTHQGLVPQYECYEICKDAWTQYIQKSLFNLVTTGKGQPNGKDKPQTENEKILGASDSKQ